MKKPRKRFRLTYLQKIKITFFSMAFFLFVGVATFFFYIFNSIPSIDILKDYRPSIATRVYADNNELIDEFFLEDRKVLAFEEIPEIVKKAFIASEDSRFYQHSGLDFWGILRAFLKNMLAGRVVQGGSTITQQVAKTMYLTHERSMVRKLREAILALRIDKYLTKNETLNLYLNHIYLGHGAYGIEAAALVYFGKSARELTLAEAAVIAGLPRAPSFYSPYNNLARAKKRQEYVLDRMLEEKFITKEENQAALKAPLEIKSLRPKDKLAPYFVENVRRYIAEKYGYYALYREGLEVFTTLNIDMQKAANTAIEKGIKEIEGRSRGKYENSTLQAALLCMDVKTGEIKAMVGGRDFSHSEFNRATQAQRQPGSVFKPFVYAAAFDKGYTPTMLIDDSPVSYPDPSVPEGVWSPKNYDEKFLGNTTLRYGLVYSRNIVTIKLLDLIGPRYVVAYAKNLGIESPLAPTLSLALGSYTTTLQELVRAYGVFANSGKRVKPFFIRKIVDRTGTIFEESQVEEELVIDPKIAYITTYVMKGVIDSGTGLRARLGRPAAGKTGTTNDMRDAWFIGFTTNYVAGVWVGFDQGGVLNKEEVGGIAAAPIWRSFMLKAEANYPAKDFPVPKGIMFNPVVYEFADGSKKYSIREVFLEDGDVASHLKLGSDDANAAVD